MALRGSSGFLAGVVLFFNTLVHPIAKAESLSQLQGMVASHVMGVTPRQVDEKYADLLSVDRRATVRVAQFPASCTGTMISDRQMLTAAHCVEKGTATGNVNIDGIESQFLFMDNRYVDETTSQFDVAVVIFPPGTGRFLGVQKYPKIAETAVVKGDAYLVGYGVDDFEKLQNKQTENDGSGIKGWGRISVADAGGGMISSDFSTYYSSWHWVNLKSLLDSFEEENQQRELTEQKKYSQGLLGDSGAALYNPQGEIFATFSTMVTVDVFVETEADLFGLNQKLRVMDHTRLGNRFVDLSTPQNQAILKAAKSCEEQGICDPHGFIDKNVPLPTRPLVGNEIPAAKIPVDSIVEPERKEEPANPFGDFRLNAIDPFEKVVMRTGRYETESGKELYVAPSYVNGRLIGVDSYERSGNRLLDSVYYYCDEELLCVAPNGKHAIFIEGKDRGAKFQRIPLDTKPILFNGFESISIAVEEYTLR